MYVDLLKYNTDGTLNVVSREPLVGDQIDHFFIKEKKYVITNIVEQRKERGTYTDESKRRMWQRIAVQLLNK